MSDGGTPRFGLVLAKTRMRHFAAVQRGCVRFETLPGISKGTRVVQDLARGLAPSRDMYEHGDVISSRFLWLVFSD